MNKILIICNTYYQLIVAIQMKLTILKNDEVTIIISDHFNIKKDILKNLEQEKIFKNVIYLNLKRIDEKNTNNILYKIKQVIYIFFSIDKDIQIKLNDCIFDKFFYYNLNVSTDIIFSILKKKNKNIECARFEEGILSYNNNFHDGVFRYLNNRMKIIFFLRKILGIKSISNVTKDFYCFYPNYYKKFLTKKRIPLINENKKKKMEVLRNIFKIKKDLLNYKQKYIFFAGIGDFEGGEAIGELELVKKIVNIVGKDNIIIKVHPRDFSNKFVNEGLLIDKFSDIPWEIIQLNYDFEDKIFLTVTSSSVLSVNLILEKPIKTYFLYKECKTDKNFLIKEAIIRIEEILHSLDSNKKSFFISSKIDKLLE